MSGGIRTTREYCIQHIGALLVVPITPPAMHSTLITESPGYCASNVDIRLTQTQGAAANITFEGNAIALYGTTNDDHGLFSVSIDDGPESTFNGSAPEPRFQMLLVSYTWLVTTLMFYYGYSTTRTGSLLVNILSD